MTQSSSYELLFPGVLERWSRVSHLEVKQSVSLPYDGDMRIRPGILGQCLESGTHLRS